MPGADTAGQEQPVLQAYSPTLEFSRIALGVDNIRYDVYLSPRWRELASRVLYEQALFHAQPLLREIHPEDARARVANLEEFKRRLGKLLIESLGLAKSQNNIEIDLLARTGILKWLTEEMRRQFHEVAVVTREKIERRSRFQARDERWTFKQRSRLSEYQVNLRALLRAVGETLFDLLEEMEEKRLRPERAALFGTGFPDFYRIFNSRLLFMENPYDSPGYLEHYVMLGRREGDPGHVDLATRALRLLLMEEGLLRSNREMVFRMNQQRQGSLEELERVSSRRREAEKHLLHARKSGERKGLSSLLGKEVSDSDLRTLEGSVATLRARQTELTGVVEELREKIEFTQGSESTRLEEVLSAPVNAEALCGPVGEGDAANAATPEQKNRCRKLFDRLRREGILPYILASYQIRKIYKDFCPPLNLHQLKNALVEKAAWKEMTTALKQFPAREFPLDQLARQAEWVRKARYQDAEGYIPRFVRDFMRLQQDFRHYYLLTALMEKVHLIEDEKTLQVSRMNHSLHSYVLAEERVAGEERVLNHVIIKADIRGSTSITDRLVSRGLNPATHFSQNFFDPVRKLMAKYNAAKIFVEGDALILGIFETDSTRASKMAVAKACLLGKEIVLLTNGYNRKAAANDLPILELGLGVGYQAGSPHYWSDGGTQVMISPAINRSDRLSKCSQIGRALMDSFPSPYRCALFQGPPTVYSGDDKEGTMIRYNVMGVMLDEEGFRRLQQEISLESVPIQVPVFGAAGEQELYRGTVPIGEQFEPLLIRQARVALLDLGDPATPKVAGFTGENYYEVCVDPGLYQKHAPPAA